MEPIDHLKKLDAMVQNCFSCDFISIEDQSAFHHGHNPDKPGGHYAMTIVSTSFQDMGILQRNRLVFKALEMPENKAIHAMSLKLYTPQQWSALKENN